jgi:hypothetical protein
MQRETSAADDSTRPETTSRVEPPNGMNEDHHGQEQAGAIPKDPALESQVGMKNHGESSWLIISRSQKTSFLMQIKL